MGGQAKELSLSFATTTTSDSDTSKVSNLICTSVSNSADELPKVGSLVLMLTLVVVLGLVFF